MILHEFVPIFARLARQLSKTDADAAMIRDYCEPLKDCPVEFVAMAADRMAQQGGSPSSDNPHWFPKTSEWRVMAAKVEAERVAAQRALLGKLRSPLCLACEDTGWERDANDRVRRCDCQKLRRLELLGVRPWPVPELGPAPETTSGGPLMPVDSSALMASLRARGLKPVIRGAAREPLRSRLARLEDTARGGADAEPAQSALECDRSRGSDAGASGGDTATDHQETPR